MRHLQTYLVSLLLCAIGCTRSVSFDECSKDADCPPDFDGTVLHCSDGLCVRGTPLDKLCNTSYPVASPRNAIVVGVLADSSAGNDLLMRQSYQLAVDQLNGLRGTSPPIELRICELNGDPYDALKSMQVLARNYQAVAVLGPPSSFQVVAIKDEVIRSGIPIMSASATSPTISGLGRNQEVVNGLFFRVAPSDVRQGPVLARQLPEPFPAGSTLAMLYVDDPYGGGLKEAFLGAWKRQPTIIRSYKEAVGGPDKDSIKKIADEIIATNPDYVIVISNLYSETVLTNLLRLPQETQILMGDAGKTQNVLNLLNTQLPDIKKHLQRVTGTAPTADANAPIYARFYQDFMNRWMRAGDPGNTFFTAYAYDAMYAVGIAIGAAGGDVTPSRVSAMLLRIGDADTSITDCVALADNANLLTIGVDEYYNAIAKLRNRNSGLVLRGLSGNICFTPHGDRLGGQYEKWSINTMPPVSFNRELIMPGFSRYR